MIWPFPSSQAPYSTVHILVTPESIMFLIPPYLASTDARETSFLPYGDFFRSELYFHSISHMTTLYKASNYMGKGQLVGYT